jgi:hypothetical protein
MGKISVAAFVLLAGLLLTGCQKTVSQQKAPDPGLSIIGLNIDTNLVSRNLGEVTLTNNFDTCVALGAGKNCVLSPKMIDSKNVQLTLTVESKTPKGRVHDLAITQVVTALGKPFEVAVGEFNFSLTPNLATE